MQLLVDGRVYAGDSYAAGNQVLDTRALPDGTYPVEIRIVEADGSTRSEFRTFTRSAAIPPRGEPVFSATAGVARIDETLLPEGPDPLVAGFSLSQRLGDRAAWQIGMLQLDARSFGQSEFVYLGERLSLQAAFVLGADDTAATSLRAGWTRAGGTLSAGYRHFASDVARDGDPLLESLYPEEGVQWDVTASGALGRYGVRASASRLLRQVEDGERGESTQYELGLRRPLFRRRDLRGTVEAGVRHGDGESFVTLGVAVAVDRGRWRSGAGLDAVRTEDGGSGVAQLATLDYARSGERGVDWGAGIHGRRGGEREAGGARAWLEHPRYRATLASDADRSGRGEAKVSSIATLSTHVGLDTRGAAVGGTDIAESGLIVAVDGEPAGESFDIVVNGVRAAVGQIGETRFIGLRPFESYAVKLVPQGMLSNGLGEEVHEFALYPGNVERIDIVAETRVLLIAALVDERGTPLGSAVVETGENPQVSDADGIVQIEASPGGELVVRALDGRRCTFVVPDAPPATEMLIPDEPLICKPAPEGPAERSADG